jgi:hypothetical protein
MSARDTRSARYWAALALPPVSQPGSAIVALDAADNTLKSSTNAGPYVPLGGGGGGDQLVKVTAADTTANFLSPKLVAGANITLTVVNPGGDETLEIAAAGGGGGGGWVDDGATVRLETAADRVAIGQNASTGEGEKLLVVGNVQLLPGADRTVFVGKSADEVGGFEGIWRGGEGGDSAGGGNGGNGGTSRVLGGPGGAGDGANLPGFGGAAFVDGGPGGPDGGIGGRNGGVVFIRGGPATLNANGGQVSCIGGSGNGTGSGGDVLCNGGAGGTLLGRVRLATSSTREVIIGNTGGSLDSTTVFIGGNKPQPFMVQGPANADYYKIVTTTGVEKNVFGNTVTNPDFLLNGSGNFNYANRDDSNAQIFMFPLQSSGAGVTGRSLQLFAAMGADAQGATAGAPGGGMGIEGGLGGDGTGALAAGRGAGVSVRGGAAGVNAGGGGDIGGAASCTGGEGSAGSGTTDGRIGGGATLGAGDGGNGVAGQQDGAGAIATVRGGASGTGGGTGAKGGNVVIEGGPGTDDGGGVTINGGTGGVGGVGDILVGDTLGDVILSRAGGKMSHFGVAPILRPDITGSRGAIAALADLLTKGASLGLWTDSTVV